MTRRVEAVIGGQIRFNFDEVPADNQLIGQAGKYADYTLSQLIAEMPKDYEEYLLDELRRLSDENEGDTSRVESLNEIYGELLYIDKEETPYQQADRIKREQQSTLHVCRQGKVEPKKFVRRDYTARRWKEYDQG